MSLVQLFYVSRAVPPVGAASVQQILATSRRNNYRDDVTGCLLFSGTFFAQVLEGDAAVAHGRLSRITDDPRHQDCRVLLEQRVTERLYSDWSMGYLLDQALEQSLAALWNQFSSRPLALSVMERMQPDPVMGSLR